MRRVAAIFILLLAAGPAGAESVAEDEPAPPSLLARLGTPARAQTVAELLGGVGPLEAGQAVRLAHALGFAGGPAAVSGVVTLLGHPSDEVRLAAMGAAARLQLRSEPLREVLLRFVEEGSPRERIIAVEAIGHIGDGRDMEVLLTLAKQDGGRLAAAAYRAMEQLTGARIPYVHARWAWLWTSFQKRAVLLLPQARDAMASAATAPDLTPLASLVKLYGWTDLPATRTAIGEWLVLPGYELRPLACTLAADLRLADLVPALRQTLEFAPNEAVTTAARDALVRLAALAPVEEAETDSATTRR